jgi:hypothetical protein
LKNRGVRFLKWATVDRVKEEVAEAEEEAAAVGVLLVEEAVVAATVDTQTRATAT